MRHQDNNKVSIWKWLKQFPKHGPADEPRSQSYEPPEFDERPEATALLANIQAALVDLRQLYADSERAYEQYVYRLYHGSRKVYAIQSKTLQIVEKMQSLMPQRALNLEFMEIVESGTGRHFSYEINESWLAETRPMVEAFLHAQYFLEMAVKYGERFDYPPNKMPYGWASVLYLFNMR